MPEDLGAAAAGGIAQGPLAEAASPAVLPSQHSNTIYFLSQV
jgi:hypothetical protein